MAIPDMIQERRPIESFQFDLVTNTEEIEQNEYGASKQITLTHRRGYISKVKLSYTKQGGGSIRTPPLEIHFFDTDPTIVVGTLDISAAEEATSLGHVVIESDDWASTTSSAAVNKSVLLPFELKAANEMWAVVKNTGAATIVGHASDGEILSMTDLTVEYLT